MPGLTATLSRCRKGTTEIPSKKLRDVAERVKMLQGQGLRPSHQLTLIGVKLRMGQAAANSSSQMHHPAHLQVNKSRLADPLTPKISSFLHSHKQGAAHCETSHLSKGAQVTPRATSVINFRLIQVATPSMPRQPQPYLVARHLAEESSETLDNRKQRTLGKPKPRNEP